MLGAEEFVDSEDSMGELVIDRAAIRRAMEGGNAVWDERRLGPEPSLIERAMEFPAEFRFTEHKALLDGFRSTYKQWCEERALNDEQCLNLLVHLVKGRALFYLETYPKRATDCDELVEMLISRNDGEVCGWFDESNYDELNITREVLKSVMKEQEGSWKVANRGDEPTKMERETVFPKHYTMHDLEELERFKREFRGWWTLKQLSSLECLNLICYLLRGEPRRLVMNSNFVFRGWAEIFFVLTNFARAMEPRRIQGPKGEEVISEGVNLGREVIALGGRIAHLESQNRFLTFTTTELDGARKAANRELRASLEEMKKETVSLRLAGSNLENHFKDLQVTVKEQDVKIDHLYQRLSDQEDVITALRNEIFKRDAARGDSSAFGVDLDEGVNLGEDIVRADAGGDKE